MKNKETQQNLRIKCVALHHRENDKLNFLNCIIYFIHHY
jgi:hypothetical protein